MRARLLAVLAALAATVTLVAGPVTAPPAVTAGQDVAAAWYSWTGKPSGRLHVPAGQWVALDVVTAAPRVSGVETHTLYVNLRPTWRSGGSRMAVCRLRYRREGGDDTALQDYAIVRGGTWTITHTHQESGQKGRGGRWWIRCKGGIKAVSIGTRYAKLSVVR